MAALPAFNFLSSSALRFSGVRSITTFGFATESTYDWQGSQWTVPLIPNVSQLIKIGKQPISFQLGVKYYAEKPDGGPDWGLRFAVTLLFPK